MAATPFFGRHGSRVSALLLAALAPACTATVEPIDVGAECPNQPLRGPLEWQNEPPQHLIDDFEDGDQHLAKAAGRNGSWIIGSDTSGVLTAENSARCAGRGGHAGHFVGSGFESWGANWTAVFRDDGSGTAVPYDATRYSAISFWVALGPDALPPYDMPVGLTTMDVAWNGGICEECMDYYRTVIELAPEWQRIVVPFDTLAQQGTGNPLTDLKPEELVGFILWPTHQFDVSIDDIRFEN